MRASAIACVTLHVAEQGSGVPVVMCHGFPGLWYSWRHQFSALAAAAEVNAAILAFLDGLR